MKHSPKLITLVAALLVAACETPTRAGNGPSFESRFGDTVRHTVQAQTYEAGDPVPPLHGDRAGAAMRVYRAGDTDNTATGADSGDFEAAMQPESAE